MQLKQGGLISHFGYFGLKYQPPKFVNMKDGNQFFFERITHDVSSMASFWIKFAAHQRHAMSSSQPRFQLRYAALIEVFCLTFFVIQEPLLLGGL